MTEAKKSNEPELIEDQDLEQASGGALSPEALKIQPASVKITLSEEYSHDAAAQKVKPGKLASGDGSV